MRRSTYQYRLEFSKHDGPRVLEVALEPGDFAHALEAAFFDGLRHGRFTGYDPPQEGVRYEPRFLGVESGSPRTAGFRVVVPAPNGGEHRVEFGPRFFRARAQRIVRELLRGNHVPDGTVLVYHLAAYLDGEARKPEPRSGFTLGPATPAVPIRPGSRQTLGRTERWDDPQPEDLPVLIPRRVLEEAVEEARRAPDREVGGVLLGHLRRDHATGELFLEIACHVPAEETEATDTSVTFTPATWARAREVVEVRGEGELFAGWVHSHPFRFCADCPLPAPVECVAKVLFYSADDEFLMGLTFPQPFMVGLQTAVEPKLETALGHLPVRLYGWRGGEIVPRGFEVFDG